MPEDFLFRFFFFFLETVYMAKILQQEKWSENFPFICILFSSALWPTVCSIHQESALNYCTTSNAGGKYKPQAKGKYALHWLWPRGMGCLQITSYLYIFLGIDLCPTAQRSYLGGFSRPKRGWPFQRNQERQRASAEWALSSFWEANKQLLTRWNPEEGDNHQGLVLKCSALTESDPFLSK